MNHPRLPTERDSEGRLVTPIPLILKSIKGNIRKKAIKALIDEGMPYGGGVPTVKDIMKEKGVSKWKATLWLNARIKDASQKAL